MKPGFVVLFLLIISALASPVNSHAQSHNVTKRTLGSDQNKKENEADKTKKEGQLLNEFGITIDPFRIISGELPVSLQYAVMDWLALEVGTGITYQNYVNDFLGDFLDSEIGYPDNLKYRIHPMFTAGIKFSPEGGIMLDDWYVGFEYRYRRYGGSYDMEYQGVIYPMEYFNNIQDYTFLYGYYRELGLIMFIDISAGLSLRKIANQRISDDSSVPQELIYDPSISRNLGLIYSIKFGWLLD